MATVTKGSLISQLGKTVPTGNEEIPVEVNGANFAVTINQVKDYVDKDAQKKYAGKAEVPTKLAELTEDATHRTVTDEHIKQIDMIYDKANRSEIPTRIQQLSEDAQHRTVTDAEKEKWNAGTGGGGPTNYGDLNNTPIIEGHPLVGGEQTAASLGLVKAEPGKQLSEENFTAAEKQKLGQLTPGGGTPEPGKSAYQIAVDNGFVGTEEEWLASLKGADGKPGADGVSLGEIAMVQTLGEGPVKQKQVPSVDAVTKAVKNGDILTLQWAGDFSATLEQAPIYMQRIGAFVKYCHPTEGWKFKQYTYNKISVPAWRNPENWTDMPTPSTMSDVYSKIDLLNDILDSSNPLPLVVTKGSGYYISSSGGVGGGGSFAADYTDAIAVKKGDFLFYKLFGNNKRALVSKTDVSTTTFTPLVIGGSDSEKENTGIFRIDFDGYISLCYSNSKIRKACICSKGIFPLLNKMQKDIEETAASLSKLDAGSFANDLSNLKKGQGMSFVVPQFEEKYGYISSSGDLTGEGNGTFVHTCPIPLLRGQKIHVIANGNNSMSHIAMTDAEGTYYKPLVIGNGSEKSCEYFASEDCFVSLSSRSAFGLKDVYISSNDFYKDILSKIEKLPKPNDADFSLSDWQTLTPYCYLFQNVLFGGASSVFGHLCEEYKSGENKYGLVSSEYEEPYSYPAQVKRLLPGWNIEKKAKSAITINAWMDMFFASIQWAEKDLAIFEFGWNERTVGHMSTDVEGKGSYNEYADTMYGNYCKLIEKVKELNPYIKLTLTIPYGFGPNKEAAKVQAINDIAQKYSLYVIDLNDNTFLGIPQAGDGIHLSPRGYLIKAVHVINTLARIIKNDIVNVHNNIYAAIKAKTSTV